MRKGDLEDQDKGKMLQTKKSLQSLHEEIVACRLCPRLVEHRELVAKEKRAAYKHCDYWGKPLPGFGDPEARLLIVGLAPAAHGGNRTGRMFTGDRSGTFLMTALQTAGFANKADSVSCDDGLELRDAYILAILRCAPPGNKPLPQEITNCRHFLLSEIALLKNVQAVLVLGKIAMDGYLAALASTGYKRPRLQFAHGAEYELNDGMPRLFVSYHPSQQNTQTKKLTLEMLCEVCLRIGGYLNKKTL